MARPLRIAFLNASLDLGGSERQMVEIALRLPRDRFAVEFVLLTHAGALAPQVLAAGIPVHVLGWARAGDAGRRVRRLGDIVRFVFFIIGRRYDILDAWLFHAYAVATATRPLTRVPVVVSGRRSLSDFKVGFHPLNLLLDSIARRWTDAIVANSEAVRTDVCRHEALRREQVRVIRNGVILPSAMEPARRQAQRERWGVRGEGLVVGCVANYKLHKGLELLLDVANDLRRAHPTARFVFVGEGALRPVLERRIEQLDLGDVVVLHGAEPDARDLYGAFDIAAFASEGEGLPNAVLEAAAAGLPIVATKAGGTAEIVIDGVSGSLLDIGDRVGFGQALDRMLRDASWRAAAGAASRAHAEQAFGMDRLVAETAALYEGLALTRVRR